jgi:hypothetical protein
MGFKARGIACYVKHMQELLHFAHERGVHVAIEAAGVPPTLLAAMQVTRRAGRVALLGNPAADVTIPAALISQIMRREIDLVGRWNSDYSVYGDDDDWHTAIKQAIARAADADSLKVIIDWNSRIAATSSSGPKGRKSKAQGGDAQHRGPGLSCRCPFRNSLLRPCRPWRSMKIHNPGRRRGRLCPGLSSRAPSGLIAPRKLANLATFLAPVHRCSVR